MALANGGAAGANGDLPEVYAAVPQVNGAVIPQVDGAGIRAAAPVAGPLAAVVAGALFPQGLAHARFDVDGALLGPLPTKSNGGCKILPKIPGEPGP